MLNHLKALDQYGFTGTVLVLHDPLGLNMGLLIVEELLTVENSQDLIIPRDEIEGRNLPQLVPICGINGSIDGYGPTVASSPERPVLLASIA
jgi:hypothetical protein